MAPYGYQGALGIFFQNLVQTNNKKAIKVQHYSQ